VQSLIFTYQDLYPEEYKEYCFVYLNWGRRIKYEVFKERKEKLMKLLDKEDGIGSINYKPN
jgi:hypothetical protein